MGNPWHETILVVEDAESIRSMVCSMLAQSGYHCLQAGDGEEALDVLQADGDTVSLVLTDIIMPRMTGAELARRVSFTRPNIRIMFMSGFADDPVVRSIETSAAVFLAKPFTANILTEKVREVLDHPWLGLQAGATGFLSR
jgi:CheY-like chemotaxis protein